MTDQTQILLQTKLHRPRLPKDLVTRWRLVNLLNQDIDRQLILVCAPAGFGKTTLVGNWLTRLPAALGEKAASFPSAWLSLDENDSDLNLFLRYFIAALRTVYRQACEQTLELLQAPQQPPQAVLNATFSNELTELPGDILLVLDDYHTLRGAEVHNLLGELVRHWPKPLHLVLVSRLSPSIPLDQLRAKGLVSEIRTRDLRFTSEETAAYLSQTQFALMIQNALPLLEERFEGWPAGLHLAAISFRYADSQQAILSGLSVENANITGYLVDEVLTHQIPAIQTFLLKTSILDSFCASLCEAVLGETDSAWSARLCLDWIERAEMFIIPLDNRREWYRYHHLFQELLQQRLSAEVAPDQVADLHRQASAWFEEHGLIDKAVHHALSAGDLDLAACQMYAGLRDALNREDRPTLERWLRLLPEEMIQRNPGLLMIKAWALQFMWRLDLQAKVLQQVEELLNSEPGASLLVDDLKILRGQILLPRAQQAYFSNQDTLAIDLCRQILALFPPSWTFVRGGAMIYLGLSMQASGLAEEAERLLLAEYEAHGDNTDTYILFVLESLGFIYLNTGRLEQARKIAQLQVQGGIRSGLPLMQFWGDWFLGLVSYQRNELEAAAEYFTQIFENRYVAQISPYRDAVAGLALIHQIKGEYADAWQMVESISQFDFELRGSEDNRTRSLRARLMLLQGDLEGAGAWVDALTDPPPDMVLLWLQEPQVIRAHILVARGSDADLRSALQILDVLYEIAERTHNTRYQIEILAVRALALNALGETAAAEAVLTQALDLARPGGFIRVFADLGSPMQAMLHRLADHGHSIAMIGRILAAFPGEAKSPASPVSPAQPLSRPSAGVPPLAEPLTPREIEVLTLLRGPSSIKEIALKLSISYATAKRHTINLYAKLGVNQRWEAVARAEELNLLPPR
jgi:LuxR family maltose regulon positive regulatory protein